MTERAREVFTGRSMVFHYLCVAIIVLFALLLRLHHLDYESLWVDEIHQVSYYSHTLGQIIKDAAKQQQPPLDYWIGHFVHLFADSDYAVRVPAALFGSGSVFLIMMIISRICSWPVALITGTIYALLPFNIFLSQEARPYSIAVFFLMAVLWSFDHALERERFRIYPFILLLVASAGFLFSRTLSPLVVFATLATLTFVHLIVESIRNGFRIRGKEFRLVLALVVFFMAAIPYLPFLKRILSMGGRYAVNPSSLGYNTILMGVDKFTIEPLWNSYVVQTAPIGTILVPCLFLSAFIVWKQKLWKKSCLIPYAAFLLPVAGLLHIFIFKAKATSGFKVHYAIYMLPWVTILSSITLQAVWNRAAAKTNAGILRVLVFVFVLFLVGASAYSTWLFKSTPRKADWRGVAKYLTTTYDREHVLTFDTVRPHGQWEATFYGFSRYYSGRSGMMSIQDIVPYAPQMVKSSFQPVLVLYHVSRANNIPRFMYSGMSFGRLRDDQEVLNTDEQIIVKSFKAFSVVTLRRKAENHAEGTLEIIEKLLAELPQDSSLVELHLAAASLKRSLNLPDWESHLEKAILISPPLFQTEVTAMTWRIQSNQR